MDDLFDPLDLIHAAPQDPIFLTTGAAMSGGIDKSELPNEDLGRLAETLAAGIPSNPVPQTCHGTEPHGSTVSALDVVLVDDGEPEVNSNRYVAQRPDYNDSMHTKSDIVVPASRSGLALYVQTAKRRLQHPSP